MKVERKFKVPQTIYLITRMRGLSQHLLKSKDFKRLSRAKNLTEMSDFLLKSDYAVELSKISEKELDAYQIFSGQTVARFILLVEANYRLAFLIALYMKNNAKLSSVNTIPSASS
jgi:vacuolar-type H+-ATPase subunit C/Vma6